MERSCLQIRKYIVEADLVVFKSIYQDLQGKFIDLRRKESEYKATLQSLNHWHRENQEGPWQLAKGYLILPVISLQKLCNLTPLVHELSIKL